jgi:hypothetical protein
MNESESDTDGSFDTDTDSDFDEEYDFDTENIAHTERICDDDYFDALHINKKLYIGLALQQKSHYLYLIHISPTNYFKYSHDIVRRYLRRYSCIELPKEATVEIMEMTIVNKTMGGGTFPVKRVVLKTHWIRLIQRCWRNAMKRRREMITCWASSRNRRHAELTGRNLPEYRHLPGLRGCVKIL